MMNVYKRRKQELWIAGSVKVWETHYGFHRIPKEFDDIVFKKNGNPDKRYKRTKDFINWTSTLDK